MGSKAAPKPFLSMAVILGVVLVAFLVGFWARDSGPFAEDEDGPELLTAPFNDDFTFTMKALAQEQRITIEVHTRDGGKVDVLLLDSANHEAYREGLPFDYIEAGSGLNLANFTVTLEVDHPDDYYWVVDNTEQPLNGAQPSRDVRFTGKVVV